MVAVVVAATAVSGLLAGCGDDRSVDQADDLPMIGERSHAVVAGGLRAIRGERIDRGHELEPVHAGQ